MSVAVVTGVCLGPGGIPKHAVSEAEVSELGLAGDGHRYKEHGGVRRAVSILFEAEAELLRKDGVRDVGPGTFGENLRIEGVAPDALRPGDRLAIGEELVLELDDVREPCAVLKSVDARFPDLMLGRSGWMCRVVQGGRVAAGMAVSLQSAGR